MLEWKPRLLILLVLLVAIAAMLGSFGWGQILPLSFGSNVFVPSDTMPGFLRTWATISPVSQLSDAARGLIIGGPVAGPLLTTTAWLAGIVLVFFPLAMRAYQRRVA